MLWEKEEKAFQMYRRCSVNQNCAHGTKQYSVFKNIHTKTVSILEGLPIGEGNKGVRWRQKKQQK